MKLFNKFVDLAFIVLICFILGFSFSNVYADDGGTVISPRYCDGCEGGNYLYDSSKNVYDYPPDAGSNYLVFHSSVHVYTAGIVAKSQTYTSNLFLVSPSYTVSGWNHIMTYNAWANDYVLIQGRRVTASY